MLQSDQQMEEWKPEDWTKEEEEKMMNEAFEWIRVDTDFEWICLLYINQPDYMFASQLQQDETWLLSMMLSDTLGLLNLQGCTPQFLSRRLWTSDITTVFELRQHTN